MSSRTIELNRPQARALRSLKEIAGVTLCLAWGRSVGKSWFLRVFCYILVAEWDSRTRVNDLGRTIHGVRIAFVGPTIEQLKKVHGKEFDDELGPGGDWECLGAKISHDSGGWRISFPGGSYIQWITAERMRGGRGLRTDVAIFDEVDDIRPEDFDAVATPWLSEPVSLNIRILAGTPTKGRHGLLYRTYKRGLEGVPGHVSIHATYRDSPATADAAKVAAAKRDSPPELFLREWECDFDSAEGLVYGEFSEKFHVRAPDQRTRWNEILVGVDFGWVDPGVFLVVGVAGSGDDATAHAIWEEYAPGKTLDYWVDKAQWINSQEGFAKFARPKWYADSSRPDSIEALRRAGCNIVGATHKIDDGILSVATLLHPHDIAGRQQARLYISPSCKNTIREFGLYRRKRDTRNRDMAVEDAEDRNNHAMDALRYEIFGRFGKPRATKIEKR